jgi:hypothetical protein
MIPGKYPITIWRGGTWSIGITQDVLDFAEYDEIRMQVRPPFRKNSSSACSSSTALLSLTLENGRITVEEDTNTLRLTISSTDTAAIKFNEGVYDLELVTHVDLEADPQITEEVVDKLLYGTVEVEGEQTI